eukprot:CAMPEP_0206500504 /NCGR_PEP_ID=MMETSP0324_2-20121206/52524_1 /ASSEMBLY_ACC=CAM_ASM_000836 /TAXON_ID=2866 /ORGANISM="Crypthecodinium cohnii, Strain Seligo" /LENGTH=338 /DNA_ID=CAMNT_0053987685 /DNA_START=335 /DNA_END=1351 /DNA_ORIENTATION=+
MALVATRSASSLKELASPSTLSSSSSLSSPPPSPVVSKAVLAAANWKRILDEPEEEPSSGRIVSSILTAAAKLMVPNFKELTVRVHARVDQLLLGRIASMYIAGRDWATNLGLTVREMVIAVPQEARVSYMKLLSGTVQLTETVQGWAVGVFNSQDFSNFLVYPPLVAVAPKLPDGSPITFVRDGVHIDLENDRVCFKAWVYEEELDFEAVMPSAAASPSPSPCDNDDSNSDSRSQTSGSDASQGSLEGSNESTVDTEEANYLPYVKATTESEHSAAAASVLTDFFQNLQMTLAGVDLRFQSVALDFRPGIDGQKEPVVRVNLSANILRVPNPMTDPF